jgi:hypothetical protein
LVEGAQIVDDTKPGSKSGFLASTIDHEGGKAFWRYARQKSNYWNRIEAEADLLGEFDAISNLRKRKSTKKARKIYQIG